MSVVYMFETCDIGKFSNRKTFLKGVRAKEVA